MLELLQFYTSSFWVWAGITFLALGALGIICDTMHEIAQTLKGSRK